MTNLIIKAITRTAEAYMIAGTAQFFELRDHHYFVGHANQNHPHREKPSAGRMREYLAHVKMLMTDARGLLYPQENYTNH